MTLPRGRRRTLGLVLVALGLAGACGLGSFGPVRLARVARVAWRLQRRAPTRGDLAVLARNGRGIGRVQSYLESQLESPDEDLRLQAQKCLAREFPESPTGAAVREYSELSGRSYFEDDWSKVLHHFSERGAVESIPLERAIERWKAFVDRYPDFPGRDDAGLRLARCEEEAGRGRDALLTLFAARGWGDRDKRFVIEDRIANVLDAQLSLEDTVELARSGPSRPLLTYSAAVKLARAHLFEEAVSELDRFADLLLGDSIELLGHAPSYFVWRDEAGTEVAKRGSFLADAAAQRRLWVRCARLEKTGDRLALASLLLSKPHGFENLVLHEIVRTDRAGVPVGEKSDDERFTTYTLERNHLAQAAAFFERVAREEPAKPGSGERAAPPKRLAALLGAAVARIGLVGYWGVAPGHGVAQSDRERFEAAQDAIERVLGASSFAELPAVAGTLAAAVKHAGFDRPVMWKHPEVDTTFALAKEENVHGH
jgi:tetratricopeptide (TPR) repeat protein